MHELSVCYGLLDQVEGIAREHNAGAVRSIHLRIGPLSGIEPELLRQAFPLASAGTVACAAALVIETADIRVRCDSCGAETPATMNRLVCAACGDWHTRLVSGDELLLASVELASEEPCATPAAAM